MKASCPTCVLALFVGTAVCAAEKGLLAHWTFDEGQGTVLHDRSGNNNHGKVKGAKWVKNGDAYALEFDGIDDCVDCGDGQSLDLRQKVSIMMWVYPAIYVNSGEPGIAGKKFASYVLTQCNDRLYAYISGGPNKVRTQWRVGTWHHVASTYDGTTLRLYLDGSLMGTNPVGKAINPGGHFWLGRSDGEIKYTKNAHFSGKMTEVRLHNRVLAPEEILRHYRTTNITNTVDALATPVPAAKKLIIELDKRGLGPRHEDVGADVAIYKQNSAGKPAGPVLLIGSADRFDARDQAVIELPAGSLQPGAYAVRVTARNVRGAKVGDTSAASFEWPHVKTFPHGPAGARKLNNLVTELLNVEGPDPFSKKYSFVNPRNGWVFMSNHGSPEATLIRQGAANGLSVPLDEKHGDANEAMRYLEAGKHAISTPMAKRLIVRAIPELSYAYYNSNPLVTEFGKFEGAFQEKYVFKNINTLCRNNDSAAKAWTRRGKRWLGTENKNRWRREEWGLEDRIYARLVKHRGFVRPYYSGVVLNEFGDSQPMCSAWAKALDRILSDPRFKGKGFYPYARNLSDGPEGRELVNTIVKHGGAVLCKRYLKEQRSEAVAWRVLRGELVVPASAYRDNCPGSVPHLLINLGIFTGPPESLDTFPHVNHKRFLDMQLNIVATAPAFEGLGGLMSYSSNYSDEETVRWVMRLFRHYAIEGNTAMLSRDPYILPHLRNGDFEYAGEGWTLDPASAGSISFGNRPGFGVMQARYPRPTEGDTVIITKRHKDKPNVLSQEIKDLEPGRLYSLRLYTGDFKDMSKQEKHAVTIQLDNVTLIPGKCFTHVFHNHRAHSYAPYDGKKRKAWMNYHWRIFRAKGPTGRLVISDWAGAGKPGGPIGQELMYNFIQVQPYFEEEGLPEAYLPAQPQQAPPQRVATVPEPAELTANWWKVPGRTCIAAYRAIGTESQEASYVNLAHPGKNTLAVRGKAPAWHAERGWTFSASDAGCLNTGILLPEGCTVAVRIANGAGRGMPVGTNARSDRDLQIEPVKSVIYYRYGNTSTSERLAFREGVLALAGPQAYRNGKRTVDTKGRWSGKGEGLPLFIGARNNYKKKGADCFFSGDILAVAIYADTLTEKEMTALTARMQPLTLPKSHGDILK